MNILFFIFVVFYSYFSFAIEDYNLIYNSNHCSNNFTQIEKKYGIPQHLLRSVSVVETGRWHDQGKTYLHWPWAVNNAGKSYYFPTKQEAINAVKRMLEMGETNIDIGCMQINLSNHPEAFTNLHQAFDPKYNIEYAANFLKSHYDLSESWEQAVAFYHSRLPVGKTYLTKVLKIWNNYKMNKLSYMHCTSSEGKITACNVSSSDSSTMNSNVYSNVKPRKDKKRLQSAMMVIYSAKN
jgi:hypothetical protein